MASLSFNAANVAPQEAFSVIPAGSYIAQVEESEVKPTSKGTGQYLKLKWRILDGQYKNRVLFGNINIVNQNPEAEQIGQRQLSGLCHAVGVMQLQDTVQLHAKPVKIKVKVRVDPNGKYDDSNDISNVEAITGAVGISTVAAPAAAAAPVAAPAAPWAKRA